MREVFRFEPPDVAPRDDDVLRAQGLPEPQCAMPRVRLALDRALDLFARLAEPRSVK